MKIDEHTRTHGRLEKAQGYGRILLIKPPFVLEFEMSQDVLDNKTIGFNRNDYSYKEIGHALQRRVSIVLLYCRTIVGSAAQ